MRRYLVISFAFILVFAASASVNYVRAAENPQPVGKQPAAAVAEPKITPLPVSRKTVKPVEQTLKPSSQATGGLKASTAKVDLRPDLIGTIVTDPPIQPPMGSYNRYAHQGKPLSFTAVVENAGATKANNVQVKVVFLQMTGNSSPLSQKKWEHNFSTSLEGWESVSYPFSLYCPPGLWVFSVEAQFSGDEKNKNNNKSVLNVQFK